MLMLRENTCKGGQRNEHCAVKALVSSRSTAGSAGRRVGRDGTAVGARIKRLLFKYFSCCIFHLFKEIKFYFKFTEMVTKS